MSKPKQSPTVGLRCRKCGSRAVRVTRTQQMLRRTFRRDTGQSRHLHASCSCVHCPNEWWSAHETALEVSKKLDKAGQESEVVYSEAPGKKEAA